MKICLNVQADSVNVLALNMDRIAVELGGIVLDELIDAANNNGLTLHNTEEPGQLIAQDPIPTVAHFRGIQCSTAHITVADNTLLFALSHQYEDFGDSEWISYTGSGYLIRLDAWAFPVLKLKQRGISKVCRRLVISLIRRYHISSIHLDAFAEILPGFATFDW